jgi:hypothetical protein
VDQSQKAGDDILARRPALKWVRCGAPGCGSAPVTGIGQQVVVCGDGLQVAKVLIGQPWIDRVGIHGDLLVVVRSFGAIGLSI